MSNKRFNLAHMQKLDHPDRQKLLPTEETLELLKIEGDSTVLDLGAGTGYFTIPAAKRTNSPVYALDIETAMLAELRKRLESASLGNVSLLHGPIEKVPLEDGTVDRVIASMVMHEVDLPQSLKELYRVMRPEGRCLIVEWDKVKTEDGPPLHHRLSTAYLQEHLENSGFQDVKIKHLSKAVYAMVFKK